MQTRTRRHGFTLVEVLMVIAIIGVLVGLIVPAVQITLNSVKKSSIAMEAQAMGTAVEQYKTKFGAYPPDGASRSDFERHFRKAFPNIAASEFAALYSVANAGNGLLSTLTVMDPAEALVFCLGGFSDDPVHPFTGTGGPLVLVPGGGGWQYNVDRNEPLFEFKQERLSVEVVGAATVSNDEGVLYGSVPDNDLLPVYNTGNGRIAPYVYFCSRTYSFAVSGSTFFNFYNPSSMAGVARPYKSDDVNTSVAQVSAPDVYFRYANDRSFQILTAGLDDNYGGVPGVPNAGTPTFYRYPSGQSLNIVTGQTVGNLVRYAEQPGLVSAQLDNAGNFSDGVLENGLPD